MRGRAAVMAVGVLGAMMLQGPARAMPPDPTVDDPPAAAAPSWNTIARLEPAPEPPPAGAWSVWSAAARAASSATQAVSQFGWELSYALGVNGTSVSAGTPATAPVIPLVEPEPPQPVPVLVLQQRFVEPVPLTPLPTPPVEVATEPPADEARVAALPRILAPLLGDLPQREADGSFFVPKAMQRLLDIRTAAAEGGAHAVTVKLPGRIIADPNAQGLVEASVPGRVEATDAGLPALGQRVRRGDVLAYVVPAIGVVDRTQIRRDVARLTNDIRAATENLEILQKFWFVPFRDGKVVQERRHLEGLRRERAALLPLIDTRETLRAPTDGVVSSVTVVAGQVIQPGQIAFEIVNPGHLWIEASASDPAAAAAAAVAPSASAVTSEGKPLGVRFVGTGLATQQQAAVLQYVIDTPVEGLRVGRPVTLFVTTGGTAGHGVAVPHESIVSGPGGIDEVWEHIDAEHFRARPVRAEPLDARTMLVDGLDPGARVVVRSARLLAQYQ